MLKFTALLLLGGSLLLSQTQPKPNPVAGDAKAIDVGHGMFRLYCSACHGMRAQGGRGGPDLSRGVYNSGENDEDLFRTISAGIAGTEMESYAGQLGDDNIWRIVAYIRSVSRHDDEGITGNRARGEQLFWSKGNCGQCHRVGSRGGRVGPDLTRIGRQRSLTHLRESIVAPNEDITPGYSLVTVVKPDGSKIVGVEKGLDNFSVQLMDLSENFHSFDRSELKSVKREFRSIMPENYGRLFNPAELDDLLSYLSSLRGEKNLAREAKR